MTTADQSPIDSGLLEGAGRDTEEGRFERGVP